MNAVTVEHRGLIGTWVKLPTVEVVELLALAGLDFVIIDLEHGTLNIETVSQMIGTARLMGLRPYVRVPAATAAYVQPVLDAGAAGIVVPQVDDVAAAQAAVRAIRFQPLGQRGASPSGRAGAWGSSRLADYLESGDEITVITQVESMAALEAIESIAGVPGVDMVLIGEVDLAASSGVALDDAGLRRSVELAETTCRSAGFSLAGVARDGADAADRLARGYALVTVSTDAAFLRSGAAVAVAIAGGTPPRVGPSADDANPDLPATAVLSHPLSMIHNELQERVTAVWFEIDHTDGAGVSSHFADDATLTIARATVRGAAEIDALYAGRHARGPRVSRHCATNLHVLEADATSARAISTLLLFAEDGEAPRRGMSPALVADVEDTFVSRRGRWLIQDRQIRPQFMPEDAGLAVPTE
jgi:2-keto-3-deoxy-L-rhamnonate aldolase RhmA